MTSADGISYRGSVLLGDFVDARLGEISSTPLLHSERQSMAQLVQKHGGQTMEASVRNFSALFPQGQNALIVARQILRDVVKWRNTDPNRRGLTCRLILGYGQVTVDGNRMHGDWTHRLSGLISHVPEYSIAALSEFVEHLQLAPPKALKTATGQMLYQLPGLTEDVEDKAQTRHAPSLQIADTGVFTEITLSIAGNPRVVRAAECPLQVGREKSCGVSLTGDMVSRVHGVISYERGKFFYADDSRNGSFVLTASGEEVFLRGERLPLIGQGAISPGAPLATQTGQVLRYSCTSSRLSMAGDKNHSTRTQRKS